MVAKCEGNAFALSLHGGAQLLCALAVVRLPKESRQLVSPMKNETMQRSILHCGLATPNERYTKLQVLSARYKKKVQ
jgi:hypothetical protein